MEGPRVSNPMRLRVIIYSIYRTNRLHPQGGRHASSGLHLEMRPSDVYRSVGAAHCRSANGVALIAGATPYSLGFRVLGLGFRASPCALPASPIGCCATPTKSLHHPLLLVESGVVSLFRGGGECDTAVPHFSFDSDCAGGRNPFFFPSPAALAGAPPSLVPFRV